VQKNMVFASEWRPGLVEPSWSRDAPRVAPVCRRDPPHFSTPRFRPFSGYSAVSRRFAVGTRRAWPHRRRGVCRVFDTEANRVSSRA